MHSIIAEERRAFTFDDVVRFIAQKLVHRHPHVFGDTVANDSETVKQNWEQLKMKEGRTSIFDNMPKALPALQRADRVQEKASKVGFDWRQAEDVWKKVREEVEELHEQVEAGIAHEKIEEEFGDVLFALVNYARFINVAPEEALHRTINKFIRRFQHVETRLREQGRTFQQSDLEEMDRYWDEAKAREEGGGRRAE
jgi:MazG family protein